MKGNIEELFVHLINPGKNGLEERSSSGGLISNIPRSLGRSVLTVLLEVLLGGSHELDSGKLESADGLESFNQQYHQTYPRASNRVMMGPMSPR